MLETIPLIVEALNAAPALIGKVLDLFADHSHELPAELVARLERAKQADAAEDAEWTRNLPKS